MSNQISQNQTNWVGSFRSTLSSQIGRRQLFVFLFVILVPVVLLSGVLLSTTFNTSRELTLEELTVTSQTQGELVELFLENSQRNLSIVVNDDLNRILSTSLLNDPDVLSQEQLAVEFDNFVGPGKAFEALALYSLDGEVIVVAGDSNDLPEDITSVTEFITAQSNSNLGVPFFDREDKNADVYLAAPIRNNFNDIQGIIFAVASLSELDVLLQPIGSGDTQTDLYLVSSDGLLLTSSTELTLSEQSLRVNSDAINGIIAQQSGSGTYTKFDGTEVYGAYTWLEDIQAGIIAEVSVVAVSPSIIALLQNVLPVALLSLALGMLLVFGIGVRLITPILRLTTTANQLSEGDLDVRVDEIGNDELGQLGSTFNNMASQLKDLVGSLEQRVQARTSDLATSAEIAAAANQIRDREELISLTVNLIRDRFDFYYVQAYIIDAKGEFAVLSDGTGYAGRRLLARNHQLPLTSQSLVANTIKSGTATVVQDTVNDPNWLANELLPDTKSEIVIPLRSQDKIIGVMDIQHNVVNAFDESQQQLFQTLADQLSITFENVSLLADTAERARRLATVAEVSIEASTERDVAKMLRTASQLTRDNFGLYHAHVYLTDENSNRLNLIAGAGEAGFEMVANKHSISLENNQSIVVQAVRSYQPVIINDVTVSETFLANPLLPETRSEMAVPMVVGGRVVGVLDVQDSKVASFNDEDAQVLQILAAQLGVAVDNAQTLQRSQESQRFLQTVTDSTPDWIFVKDQNYRYTFVNESYAHAMNISAEKFVGKDDIELGFSEDTVFGNAAKDMIGFRVDDNKVLKEGQSLRNPYDPVVDAHGSQLILDTSRLPMYDNEGNIIGVFGISRDVTERNQQEVEARRRASKMQAVTEISSQIAGTVDIDSLLWNVSELTANKLDHYHVQIYLLSDNNQLVLRAGSGEAGSQMVQNRHALSMDSQSLVARAARNKEAVIINDVLTIEDYLPNPMLPETQAEIAIPILYGDELMGVLDVLDRDINIYSDIEIQVNTTLANQIATAIQNARQFELTQIRLQEVLALNAIADFVREIEDIEAMLESVLTISYNSLDATNSVFSYYDHDKDQWQGFVGVGMGIDSDIAKTFIDAGERYPHGMEAIRTGEIVAVEDVLQYPDFPPDFIEILGLKSVLVIPIIVDNEPIGVIFLNYSETNHAFSEDDLRLALTIGNQIAIGLERQKADDEVRQQTALAQRRASELETVANVSAASTTLLNVDELLQSVVDLSKQNFDLYHAHVYLFDADNKQLILAAGAGEVGALMKESGHRLNPDSVTGLVARAVRSRQAVVVNDVTLVEDFLPNPMLPETRSEMAVPLIVGDEVIGVLDLQSDVPNRFDEEDIRIQGTLASQISVAIRNAQAFERERRTVERLREVDRLKQEFLANMSHELRTPLNSIIGYSEVLLDGIDGDLTEDAIEDVDAIYTSGKHLLSIINEILDLAKIDAGQMFLSRYEKDLVEILQQIVTSSQVLVKDKNIEILLEEASPVPMAYIDTVRMNQIMLNLVSNAIKFTEEGSVTVRYGMLDDNYMRIEVIDTGMGMNAEQLALIFQRFSQVDGSSTRRAGGTGLGLTITKQLVEMHGGEVGVSSEVDEGSTFFFTLPVVELAKQMEKEGQADDLVDVLSEPVAGD